MKDNGFLKFLLIFILIYMWYRNTSGLTIVVIVNGHGDLSSNPGWDYLHFR